jgi:hypothetical protein
MTKIAFPLHYTLMAVYAKNRTQYPLLVSETAEFDVRELDESEAPVVASVDTKWKLPIRHIDNTQRRAKTEEFGIRTFEDRFYVPVRQYIKNNVGVWSNVTAANFPDIHRGKEFAVSPFELPVEKAVSYAINPIIGSKTATSFDGGRNDYDSFKVKTIGNPEVREKAVQDAAELVERFAFINGELWLATKSEPVIKYDRRTNDRLFIDLVESHSNQFGQEDEGYFRLNRLDECKEFLASAYPGVEVTTHIKGIKTNEAEAFRFEDDAKSLKTLAQNVHLELHQFAERETSNQELQSYSSRIGEAVTDLENGTGDADKIAEIISEIAHKFTGQYRLNVTAMNAMVDRWNLRPMESSMRLGR